jgi:murein DD-endopeptidase MepM/ murein hydrolase activator NlpD
MDASARLSAWLKDHPQSISKVVDITNTDRLLRFNLTATNTELNADIVGDTAKFSQWVDKKLADNHCRYGIGGYMELRTIYDNRAQFDTTGEERRNLHLGVDIWGDAGTPVYAPLSGTIHSFQDNGNFGDYGPTIILTHNLNGFTLYSLYGHLSRANLAGLSIGQPIASGQQIANLGEGYENGNWPPHLHFQLMLDMEGKSGDYYGACRKSEKEKYLQNIPDPQLLLQFPAGMVVE